MHGSRALGEPRSTSWPSWRRQVHDLDMKSSVYPKCKTSYHVGNWPAYDRALVQRGDIPVWLAPNTIATWEVVGVGTRGGQLQCSDLAIETALPLRLIFHLPLPHGASENRDYVPAGPGIQDVQSGGGLRQGQLLRQRTTPDT